MSLTDLDKKFITDTVVGAVQTSEERTGRTIDRAIRASEERSDKKRAEQSEFFSNALRNQTQQILASVAAIDKLEAVENRVEELEDEVAHLKTKLKVDS